MPFFSLDELVVDHKNGRHFSDAKELSRLLMEWFEVKDKIFYDEEYPEYEVTERGINYISHHPSDDTRKWVETEVARNEILRNVRRNQGLRWSENWIQVVLPKISLLRN